MGGAPRAPAWQNAILPRFILLFSSFCKRCRLGIFEQIFAIRSEVVAALRRATNHGNMPKTQTPTFQVNSYWNTLGELTGKRCRLGIFEQIFAIRNEVVAALRRATNHGNMPNTQTPTFQVNSYRNTLGELAGAVSAYRFSDRFVRHRTKS